MEASDGRCPCAMSRRWNLPGRWLEILTPSRAAKLAAALSADPALAVWAAWQARDSSPTIESLAAWLAARLIALLDSSHSGAITFSAEQHGQFAALVAESVAAASETTRSNGDNGWGTRPEYLAALTGHWREWCAVCGGNGSETIDWPLAAPAASESLSAESRATGDAAWRRWLMEIPAVHPLLPSLVLKLGQSAQLQRDFEGRLETAKLESLKEFAYGAGHELNNPLANIASRADVVARRNASRTPSPPGGHQHAGFSGT